MKFNFRQGVHHAPLTSNHPDYLIYNPGGDTVEISVGVDLVRVTGAFRDVNYLHEEREDSISAWGPFAWNSVWGTDPLVYRYYLYWDWSLATGQVTRGYTPWQPIVATSAPISPARDQHWFDTLNNVQKYWDGGTWRECIRVFAGWWDTGLQTVEEYDLGTQVGIYEPTDDHALWWDHGYILFGADMKGVKYADGTFFTTGTQAYTFHGSFSSPIRLELASTSAVANEPIPAFYCVSNIGDGTIQLASGQNIERRPIGIVLVPADPGEAVDVITQGYVFNDQWNWSPVLGKDLYCGPTGELRQGVVISQGGVVRMGTIIGPQTVLVDIDTFGVGPPGINGDDGNSGYSGLNGLSGYSGSDGASGYSGLDGISVSGYSGYSGPQGPQGLSGYSGAPAPGGGIGWPLQAPPQYNYLGADGRIPFSFVDSVATGVQWSTSEYASGTMEFKLGASSGYSGAAPAGFSFGLIPLPAGGASVRLSSNLGGFMFKSTWNGHDRDPLGNDPNLAGMLRASGDYAGQRKIELNTTGGTYGSTDSLGYATGYQTITPFQASQNYYGPDCGSSPQLDFGVGNSIVWRLDPRGFNGNLNPVQGLGGGDYTVFLRLARPDPKYTAYVPSTSKLVIGLSGLKVVAVYDVNSTNTNFLDISARPISEIVVYDAGEKAYLTTNVSSLVSVDTGFESATDIGYNYSPYLWLDSVNATLWCTGYYNNVTRYDANTDTVIDALPITFPNSDPILGFGQVEALWGNSVLNKVYVLVYRYSTGVMSLLVIDGATNTLDSAEDIPNVGYARGLTVDEVSGNVYVGGYDVPLVYSGFTVSVFNSAGTLLNQYSTPVPTGYINVFDLNNDKTKLYCGVQSTTLQVMDTSTGVFTPVDLSLSLSCAPQDIAFDPVTGDAFLVDDCSSNVARVADTDLTVTNIGAVSQPARIAMDPDSLNDRFWTTSAWNPQNSVGQGSVTGNSMSGGSNMFPPITGSINTGGYTRWVDGVSALTMPTQYDESWIVTLKKANYTYDFYYDTNWHWYVDSYTGPYPD